MFRFKVRVSNDLVSGVVYEYACGRCNFSYYGKTEKHLKGRSVEHIGISPLIFKKTKPSKESFLKKRDQPVLNKNISSATLHLFDTV